jgi:hypothetical protein
LRFSLILAILCYLRLVRLSLLHWLLSDDVFRAVGLRSRGRLSFRLIIGGLAV